MADGLVQKETAAKRGITMITVAFHVRTVYDKYDKLDVKNAPAAVAKAYQTGIMKKAHSSGNAARIAPATVSARN